MNKIVIYVVITAFVVLEALFTFSDSLSAGETREYRIIGGKESQVEQQVTNMLRHPEWGSWKVPAEWQ